MENYSEKEKIQITEFNEIINLFQSKLSELDKSTTNIWRKVAEIKEFREPSDNENINDAVPTTFTIIEKLYNILTILDTIKNRNAETSNALNKII